MILVTLATGPYAVQDLKYLFWSIEHVYAPDYPDLYIYTDTDTSKVIPSYKGNCQMRIALDAYSGLNRKQMEQIRGVQFPTKWTEFMCEKISAMRYAFEMSQTTEGIWFLDADITLFDKLPTFPEDTEVALAPHSIRPGDEAKFGRYNGGFLWIKNQRLLDVWWTATKTSRFYEQAALEEVARASQHLVEIPIQHNFGWWRLWQGIESSEKIMSRFGFSRNTSGIGLSYDGKPLGSVHTHWYEKNDIATFQFNEFLVSRLQKLGNHKPAAAFLKVLRK